MANQNQPNDAKSQAALENHEKWFKDEKAKLLKYCSNKHLNAERMLKAHYVSLPPLFALWAVESKSENKRYWVITGDLPHDHIDFKTAKNSKDALRHFSLSWQLKADLIINNMEQGAPSPLTPEQQKSSADLLIEKATMLYDVLHNEALWDNAIST